MRRRVGPGAPQLTSTRFGATSCDRRSGEESAAVDDVDVWELRLGRAASLASLYATLSDDERARVARMRRPLDRRRYVLVRGRLREILSQYLGRDPATLRITADAMVKPRLLDDETLRFNVSHSGSRGLIVVARDREVGIDVEAIRAGPAEDLAVSELLAAEERTAIAALRPSLRRRAFFACWTRKEAYLKATGEGLGRPLDSFAVSVVPGASPISLSVPDDPAEAGRWRIVDLSVGPSHAAALAVEGHDWCLRMKG